MTTHSRAALAVAVLMSTAAGRGAAQASPSPVAKDTTAPSYDMKAQALVDLEDVNKKFVSLAQAMPQKKFTWRPSADTRSFAEVLLHVSAERYQLLALMGAVPPSEFTARGYEKSTTDQAAIIQELNKSWEFTRATISAMPNAEFATLLPNAGLGPQANAGDVVYILEADAHEHLGQSIAYARVNGIVPPWTAAARKGKMS